MAERDHPSGAPAHRRRGGAASGLGSHRGPAVGQRSVVAAAKDVGRALQAALRDIEAANPGRLDGIFGGAAWTNKERLPDATLKNLLEHFSKHTLSLATVPEDELGNGYEFLIKKFADDAGHTAAGDDNDAFSAAVVSFVTR